MGNNFSKRVLVDIFAILVSLGVFAFSIACYFFDELSLWIGSLILKTTFSDLPNEYPLGKIVAFGLLPFAPLLLLYLSELIFKDNLRVLFRVLTILLSIGLIVVFYIFTPDLFSDFKKQDEWFWNLGRIYIWYLFPILSGLEIYLFCWLDKRLRNHPVVFAVFCVFIMPLVAIGIPLLMGILGVIVSVAIIVLFIIFVVRIFAAMADGASSSSSTTTVYKLDDGTEVTHDYSNYYKDEYGNRYVSDDGGNTFYKD